LVCTTDSFDQGLENQYVSQLTHRFKEDALL
jgi:hypothetical protein